MPPRSTGRCDHDPYVAKDCGHADDRTPLPAMAPSDPSRATRRGCAPADVRSLGAVARNPAGPELPPFRRPARVVGNPARRRRALERRVRTGRSLRGRKDGCARPHQVSRCDRSGVVVPRIGFGSSGIGSAWYHLDPDDVTLAWDRLPITLVFTGVLGTAIAQRVGEDVARVALAVLFELEW